MNETPAVNQSTNSHDSKELQHTIEGLIDAVNKAKGDEPESGEFLLSEALNADFVYNAIITVVRKHSQKRYKLILFLPDGTEFPSVLTENDFKQSNRD